MPQTLDPVEYRKVVGRFATGVTVVTTVAGDQHHGLTCNSFTSASLAPVRVLFCAEKVARFHDAVLAAGTWGVSVLSSHQEHLSRRFAARGRPLEGQFDDESSYSGSVTGAALFHGALAALECETVATADAGDHTVLIGAVLSLSVPDPEGSPLVFYEGDYRALGA